MIKMVIILLGRVIIALPFYGKIPNFVLFLGLK